MTTPTLAVSSGGINYGGPIRMKATATEGGNTGPDDATLQKYLSGSQRDAYEAVNNLFTSYGLGSLAPKIFDYIQKGYSADTVGILLQNTDEYKQRFQGNELRKAAGLPVLSPAEYLATEQSYRQIMRQSGLPAGFYDQPSDFNQFIGKDVSPTELKGRVDLATQATSLANPSYKEALQKMYGLNDSHIAAYFLDPDRATPVLQKQAAAAQIGSEALRRGLQVNTSAEEQYAMAGVTQQQAAQAYSQIAQELPAYSNIAGSFGERIGQATLEQAILGPAGATSTGTTTPSGGPIETAQAKLERLASWNRARSEGRAAAGAGGVAAITAGQI